MTLGGGDGVALGVALASAFVEETGGLVRPRRRRRRSSWGKHAQLLIPDVPQIARSGVAWDRCCVCAVQTDVRFAVVFDDVRSFPRVVEVQPLSWKRWSWFRRALCARCAPIYREWAGEVLVPFGSRRWRWVSWSWCESRGMTRAMWALLSSEQRGQWVRNQRAQDGRSKRKGRGAS